MSYVYHPTTGEKRLVLKRVKTEENLHIVLQNKYHPANKKTNDSIVLHPNGHVETRSNAHVLKVSPLTKIIGFLGSSL